MLRRRFIALGAAAVAAVGSGAGWLWWRWRQDEAAAADEDEGACAARPADVSTEKARFPERYRAALGALCERLIPDEPDSEAVGAVGAHAFEYIERELARADMQGPYRLAMRGAAQLDVVSRERLGVPFVAADGAGRDAVIAAMLAGAGAASRFVPGEFLRTMMGLTLEGMFCDPIHGGNFDGEGWMLIGYPMHPPRPGGCP